MSMSSYDPEHCGILTIHVIILESLFVASFSRLSSVIKVFWNRDHVSNSKKNIEETLAIAEDICVYKQERIILYLYGGKISRCINCSERYKKIHTLANRTSGYLLLPLYNQQGCVETLREDTHPFTNAFLEINEVARQNMSHTFFYKLRCDDFHFKKAEWNWVNSVDRVLNIRDSMVLDVFPDSIVVKTSDYIYEALGVYEEAPATFLERFEPIATLVGKGIRTVVVFYSGIDGDKYNDSAYDVSCMLKRMLPDKDISFHILPPQVIVDCMVMSLNIYEQNVFSMSHFTYNFFDEIYMNCMNKIIEEKKIDHI